MNDDIIDIAIQRHLRWVADFNAALAGHGSRDFDLEKARDDTACALGKWLSSPEAQDYLGDDLHSRATAIHGTFHEIAAEVVACLRANDPQEVTQGLIDALGDLSKSLVEFLEFARKRMHNAPPEHKD
jgi:hypothetical protein